MVKTTQTWNPNGAPCFEMEFGPVFWRVSNPKLEDKQVLGIYIYFVFRVKHQQQNDPSPFLAPVCTLLGCNGFGLTECHVHHALWSGGSLDDKGQTAMDMKLGKMGEVLEGDSRLISLEKTTA